MTFCSKFCILYKWTSSCYNGLWFVLLVITNLYPIYPSIVRYQFQKKCYLFNPMTKPHSQPSRWFWDFNKISIWHIQRHEHIHYSKLYTTLVFYHFSHAYLWIPVNYKSPKLTAICFIYQVVEIKTNKCDISLIKPEIIQQK